jgi:membrane dipeptidase
VPVAGFDGHNDTLLRLLRAGLGEAAFLEGDARLAVDLPRARAGAMAAGLFAMYTPSGWAREADGGAPEEPLAVTLTPGGYEVAPPAPVAHPVAAQATADMLALAGRIAAASGGRVEVVRDLAALDACRAQRRLGLVLHLEGAEALRPGREDLERLHARGLRSLGPVWSRPNAFGHGVPFRFPGDPGTGPGLTAAGLRLVRDCGELGVLVDVSHLTAAGFWDVARTSSAPLVATHSGVHARCPVPRNLTDDQLDAIAASDGLVGVIFEVSATRPDGRDDPDTPLAEVARHAAHVAERVGVRHVALGSDWDGATVPRGLASPAGLPALHEALRAEGFGAAEVEAIAWGNWRRVLGATWRA